MECQDLAERLTDFMEGDLEPEEQEAALEHLATCSQCELVLAQTNDVVALASSHGQAPLTNADRERMLTSLQQEAAKTLKDR